MKERYRRLRGILAIEAVVQDVRHGWRMLRNNPGFTLIAVVSLAIGIGANAATFSLADALLLRPLPVPRPGDVMTVGSMNVATSSLGDSPRTSYRDYVDVRDRSESFAGLTASGVVQVQFAAGPLATPDVRTGMVVSGNFFGVMDVVPQLGRAFLPEEDRVPGRNAVMVLSHGFWARQFGADPNVLGRGVRLNGIEFTVVGVAPERFTGTDHWVRPDFYVPIMMWPALGRPDQPDPLEQRDLRALVAKGRLRDGVSLEQAQAEVGSIGTELAATYPGTNRNQEMFVRTELQNRIRSGLTNVTLIAMLTTLAAAVLLVACANVAGLLTSRAPARAAEVALRLAIGAGRGRMIRQMLVEHAMLAGLGAIAGVGLGYLGVLLWRQITLPSDVPVDFVAQMDRRALVVSLTVAVVSVFLFGLTPAIQTARAGLADALRDGGRTAAARRRWGQSALVAVQVAVSLVLLSVTSFMYVSFQRQLATGPGFRTDHLLMMTFNPGLSQYTEPQAQRFYEQLVDRSGEVAGVETAALASFIPMSSSLGSTPVLPEGYDFPEGTESASVFTSHVGADFFDAMAIPILQGRVFETTDSADAPRVAIVNRQLADRYWPDQNPVGRRFRMDDVNGPWVEIVGVVPTSKYMYTSEPPLPFLYLPSTQHPMMRMTLVVQSAGEPLALVEPLREVVRGLDANLAIVSVRTMDDFYRDNAVGNLLVILRAIAAMGVMAVTLAFVGLYGLVADGVGRRTREIGIRMAVGATQGAVLRMILRHGLSLAVVGLAVGLVLTFGADRALQAAFPGGSAGQRGPAEYVATTIALLGITALAAYLPARRAARIEPIRALRHE